MMITRAKPDFNCVLQLRLPNRIASHNRSQSFGGGQHFQDRRKAESETYVVPARYLYQVNDYWLHLRKRVSPVFCKPFCCDDGLQADFPDDKRFSAHRAS